MALSFIGSATGTNTATMPAHQAGDLLIVLAQRVPSSTLPIAVAGWTAFFANTANTMGWRAAYKVAASSSEVVGTWTNAGELIVLVYRGAVSPYIGTSALSTATGGGTINFAALSLGASDNSCWVVAFAGARTASSTIETTPSGMSLRGNQVTGSGELVAFDTSAGVASWPSINGGDALTANWKTLVVEIIGDAPATGITGSASITLGAVTASAEGSLAVGGTAAGTLGAVAVSAGGALGISADASVTLGPVTSAAVGALGVSGDGAVLLGAVTASAAGSIGITGSASITLGAVTVSAAGSLGGDAVQITPVPLTRVFAVGREVRLFAVPAEIRAFAVPAELRIFRVKGA